MPTLHHFSDDSGITTFQPRPVKTPVSRAQGEEWLNGPLVWAIDQPHSFLYLFPRDCPRILLWETASTTAQDKRRWLGDTEARAIAYIESRWEERFRTAKIFRYDLPADTFEDLREIGMWVSRVEVKPKEVACVSNLADRLEASGVDLRIVDALTPMKPVWESTVHASGIRLRNAANWGDPGWPHSRP